MGKRDEAAVVRAHDPAEAGLLMDDSDGVVVLPERVQPDREQPAALPIDERHLQVFSRPAARLLGPRHIIGGEHGPIADDRCASDVERPDRGRTVRRDRGIREDRAV